MNTKIGKNKYSGNLIIKKTVHNNKSLNADSSLQQKVGWSFIGAPFVGTASTTGN